MSEIVDGQVRALRKRQLIGGFRQGIRDGAYWSVRSDIADYDAKDTIPIPEAQRRMAMSLKTRLAALDEATMHALVNWGYAIADSALRTHVYRDADPPAALPFR